jgi:hypothetical protein
MPTHVGPNISGEENLVFGYDLSDQKNSYLGEPTTNLANNTPLLGGWPGSYTLIDSATKTFDFTTSSVEWGGVAAWTTFYYNVSEYTGQYVTISAVVESFDETSGVFSFMWIGQTINDETYLGYSPEQDRNTKTTKTRERISWSGVIGTGGKVGILIWMNNGTGGPSGSVKVRFSNLQVEVKSHPTLFVNGTRSATQGLLDLKGTSTINISTTSFDNSSQLIFDGSDDYITLSSTSHPTGSCSMEIVINHTHNFVGSRYLLYGANGTAFWVFFRGDWAGNLLYFTRRVINSGNYGDSAWGYTTGIYQPVPANETMHLIFTHDTSSGEFKCYKNGILTRTVNGNLAAYGALNTTQQSHYIGGSPGDNLPMTLPLFKFYDRVLSPSEVLNNYNNIKRKYGI